MKLKNLKAKERETIAAYERAKRTEKRGEKAAEKLKAEVAKIVAKNGGEVRGKYGTLQSEACNEKIYPESVEALGAQYESAKENAEIRGAVKVRRKGSKLVYRAKK